MNSTSSGPSLPGGQVQEERSGRELIDSTGLLNVFQQDTVEVTSDFVRDENEC